MHFNVLCIVAYSTYCRSTVDVFYCTLHVCTPPGECMYSNVFRCTLLCFWSTCTPDVLLGIPFKKALKKAQAAQANKRHRRNWRQFSYSTRTLCVLFQIAYSACTLHVLRHTRWASLQYSTPTVLCVVLCGVLCVYSGGGGDMVMGGVAVPLSGVCTLGVL